MFSRQVAKTLFFPLINVWGGVEGRETTDTGVGAVLGNEVEFRAK